MEISCSSEQRSPQRNYDQVSVDVAALTFSLTQKLNQSLPISKEPFIHKVSQRLKELNEKMYIPQCVSIGPYHHGKPELKEMEEHKILYLKLFLQNSNVRLEEFVLCVKENETRLRNSYQGRVDLDSERFVKLMLVDAVFVIMVILKTVTTEFDAEDKMLFDQRQMLHDISYEMLLLENQVPFFILDELLRLSNFKAGRVSFLQLCSDFISIFIVSWMVNPLEMSQYSDCKHLVDLLRIGQQPLEMNKHTALDLVILPSAVQLHQAGVRFKLGSSRRFADITFNFRDGILEIPQLRITAKREIFFRNVQAFEQSNFYSSGRYFNDYIAVISLLVTNEKDVEILSKKRIIENFLHSNEGVVHLLKNLNKGNLLNPKQFYFADVVNALNKYSRKRRNGWRASLIQNYFYSPWAIVSFSAGAIVILLTVIQTICSVMQVKQQP